MCLCLPPIAGKKLAADVAKAGMEKDEGEGISMPPGDAGDAKAG